MSVFKKYFVVLFLFFISTLVANDSPWTGKWHLSWQEGTMILNLEQHGNDVNGTYDPSNGILKGKIEGNTLHAKATPENNVSGLLSLTMSDSQKSFFGNINDSFWISTSYN